MKFDFSGYHPRDHWPGARRCWAHPGGPRRHLRSAWVMDRRDQVLRPWRKVFFCPVGRHRWRVWYGVGFPDGRTRVGVTCADCAAERLPSEHEIYNPPRILRWLEGEDE